MTDVELIVDWLDDLAANMRAEIEPLTLEGLYWQPDAEANSIGVTVWHVARWLDLLKVRILENRPPDDEQWHTRGWRESTGYDPRGIGSRGLGAISGYTLEEVAAIPRLSAHDLAAYLDQVCGALRQHLLEMPDGALHEIAPGLGGKYTAYDWIKAVLPGCFGHLGEIQALKAMYARASRGSIIEQAEALGA